MVIYLHEALDRKLNQRSCTEQDIYDATFEGRCSACGPS